MASEMADAILALNVGSSSLKFGLFTLPSPNADPAVMATGSIRDLHGNTSILRVTHADGTMLVDERRMRDARGDTVEGLLDWAQSQSGDSRLIAVGHRVVHGGAEFSDPVEIDAPLLARLDALTTLAPLHQPASLAPIRRIRELRPDLRQFACFDTAFHRRIGPPANRYALPLALEAEGIRRYGFHGLSYESIAAQLGAGGETASGAPATRVVVAHLGNGASLCAMAGLESVDTTMGFSALDGLVMGTRPGALDPGILLYLMQVKHYSVTQLEELLYKKSGLLGASGISADVAELVASDSPAAAAALDLFAFQVARQTAALAATLGGIDRFIFTGGIGEHSPAIRRMIADRLQWLGAELDEQANDSNALTISSDASNIHLERRSTQEELMIARHVAACIGD